MQDAIAQIGAADGFAIAMLGVILLSMGTLATLFFCMRRSASKRDPQVDALLEELEAEEREQHHTTTDAEAKSREPWEREADWWKS